jgi:hypothetical protein
LALFSADRKVVSKMKKIAGRQANANQGLKGVKKKSPRKKIIRTKLISCLVNIRT